MSPDPVTETLAPAAAKRPRQGPSHHSATTAGEPPPTYRVGRTEAVRYDRTHRCWRVGRLVQVWRNEPHHDSHNKHCHSNASPCHGRDRYLLAYETGDTEILSERRFRRSVRLYRLSLGTRLAVYWREHRTYYPATIMKLRDSSQEAWYVRYDHGEQEWINLARTKFLLLSPLADEWDAEEDPSRDDDSPRREKHPSRTQSLASHGHSSAWAMVEGRRVARGPWQWTHTTTTTTQTRQPTAPGPPTQQQQHAPLLTGSVARPPTNVTTPSAGRDDDKNDNHTKLEFWGLPDRVARVTKGCRIALWWPREQYPVMGTVVAQRNNTARLEYPRGQKEWIDLRKYRFKILGDAQGTHCTRTNEKQEYTLQEPQGETTADRIGIGSHIAIYWASLGCFRDCVVIDRKSDGRTKPYWLQYTDGDREWVNFDRLLWRFQPETRSSQPNVTEKQGDGHAPHSPASHLPVPTQSLSSITHQQPTCARRNSTVEANTYEIEPAGKQLEDVISGESLSIRQGDATGESEPSIGAITASPTPPNDVFSCEDAEGALKREPVVEVSTTAATLSQDGESMSESSVSDMGKEQTDQRHRTRQSANRAVSARIKVPRDAQAHLKTDAVEEIVAGSRIKIWQEVDNAWTNAMVTNIRLGFGAQTHQVEYDNGESQWLDFSGLTFRFLRGSKRHTEEVEDKPDEADTPEPEDNELEILPGSKIRVWEPSTKLHFVACVLGYRRDGRDKPYYIERENGNREWTGFRNRSFRFCSGSRRCHSPIHKTKLYSFPEIQVGARVFVWWDNKGRWFVATVTKIKPDRERPHFLEYDDGDKEWLDLQRMRFMIDDASEDQQRKPMSSKEQKKKRSRNQSTVDSCDSESGLDDGYHSLGDDGGVAIKVEKHRRSLERNGEWQDQDRMRSKRRFDGSDVSEQSTVEVRASRRKQRSLSDDTKTSRPNPAKKPHVDTASTSLGSLARKPRSHWSKYKEPACDEEALEMISSIHEGSRVSVWWDGENAFYSGTVTLVREGKRPFCLDYDDGDREWVDLRNERFRVLQS